MTLAVGSWVRRKGKWHRVESVIADAAITRCGRRMEPGSLGAFTIPLEVSEVAPFTRDLEQPQLCRRCR